MKMKNLLLLFLLTALMGSCKKDDGTPDDVDIVPPRSLSEAADEDNTDIRAYLETHFYNYEEFNSPPAGFDFKIKFDTIAGDNADKTPIMDMPTLKSEIITVSSSDFGRDDEEVVDHILYYLIVRERDDAGEVNGPTIGDYAVVRYEGSLLNGTVFDASTHVEARFNLSRVVRGFGNAIEYLRPGIGPFENGDGTVRFDDYGIGAVFMPSGLGYFSNAQSIIPAYTPIVFKVDLLSFEPDTDFDDDGIPSILEDLNGDGNLNNDNTDQDTETTVFIPNYIDTDDDADGIPTSEEIDIDELGNVTFRDTDGDGIKDHLDNDN
jgi:FKBP-type peptidyl-prolyl cis-trans isomerase FkpA